VLQHINADRFSFLYESLGITDVFWSHARHAHSGLGDIKIHPFPLFPAQTPRIEEVENIHRPRRWLANFIGAYNPSLYLTDVREHIFSDAGAADLLIIKREDWHFERADYEQQIAGVTPDAARLSLEGQQKLEYLEAIRESAFTLCPTGSGPNSIRVCEALALGSIPVILTRDLALPGCDALWEAACVIEDDSVEGYRRAIARIRAMDENTLRSCQRATQELYEVVRPCKYDVLIRGMMNI